MRLVPKSPVALVLLGGWLAACLGLLLLQLDARAPRGPGGEGRRAGSRGEALEDEAALVGVDRVTPDGPSAQADPAAPATVSKATARRPVLDDGVTPAAAVDDELAPPVMGVVVDARGRTLAGVRVRYRPKDELDQVKQRATTDGNEILIFSSVSPAGRPRGRAEVTDARGAFTYEGSDRRVGGWLSFGEDLLVADVVTVDVDPEATYQVLTLPDGEVEGSVWTVTVTDQAGAAVVIEHVELDFVKGPTAPLARLPQAIDRFVSVGSVEQRGLPPGRWRMTLRPAIGLTAVVEVQVDSPGSRLESRLLVESHEGTIASRVGVAGHSEDVPWVDPGSGMLDWLPEARLHVGENRRDSHFAHTMLLGSGEVRAAELTLELESNSGMGSNDSLYLHHLGARKFAWGRRVHELTGLRWTRGERATLRLDLSRLPLKGGGTFNLLPLLESGRLDVMLQDDTVVHDVSIRLLR